MFSTIATILIAVSLVLGGGSLTVAGAQSSLPDQPLYSVKLLSEDARLRFTSGTEALLQLQLQFTDRRASEIKTMLQNGQVPPATTQSRYQNQIEQTLTLAIGMPDEKAVQALEQVRLHLQNQQQAFFQLNLNANPQAAAALMRARQMLQQRLDWVEQGLTDPTQLRQQMQQGANGETANPFNMGSTGIPAQPGMGGGNPWTTGTPTPGSGYGPGMGTGDCTTCTPNGSGMGSNPWTTGTPTPGSGYGPGMGTGDCTTCTPNGGGTESNPWTDSTPTPGSSYGPGPMPSQTQGAGSGTGMPSQTQGAGSGMGMPSQTPGSGSGMGPEPQPTSGMGGGGMHH